MMKVIAASIAGGISSALIVLGVSGAAQGRADDMTPTTSMPAQTLDTPTVTPTAVAYTPEFRQVAASPVADVRPRVIRERIVTREAPRTKQRAWQKTALVIGGGGGAGAGLGALIGGKKGALIGAAIGGGSGAIYEATKRK